MAHIAHDRSRLTARVRRIAGQVAAIEKAIAGSDDCGAVLQQLAAVRGAVNGLILQLLEGHLREHVAGGARDAALEEELAPVLAVLKSYLK
jgi:DNA-binding FrmR family transcriptional regulator